MDEKTIAATQLALQTETPLGNDRFKEKIEKHLKVNLGCLRQGRLRKE
jgi:hypothetical protein